MCVCVKGTGEGNKERGEGGTEREGGGRYGEGKEGDYTLPIHLSLTLT